MCFFYGSSQFFQVYFTYVSVLTTATPFRKDLYRFCHKFLNIPQFFFRSVSTTTISSIYEDLNCSSSTPQAVLQYGSIFVTDSTDFTSYNVFSVSPTHEVRTGSSPRTSQGRSGPTSLNLSVFIFWGLSHYYALGIFTASIPSSSVIG